VVCREAYHRFSALWTLSRGQEWSRRAPTVRSGTLCFLSVRKVDIVPDVDSKESRQDRRTLEPEGVVPIGRQETIARKDKKF
jgi:hypothetical protein